MGFLDWIDDVKRSKQFERYCDSNVLEKYTFSVAGVRYARYDTYFRPYFKIDNSNNVYAVEKPESPITNNPQTDPTGLRGFGPVPFPTQEKFFPHMLVYKTYDKRYEYEVLCEKGKDQKIYDLTTNDCGYYPFVNYESYLKNVNDLCTRNKHHYLKEYSKYNMPLKEINLDNVYWHESYHNSPTFKVEHSIFGKYFDDNATIKSKYVFQTNSIIEVGNIPDGEERIRHLWLFDFETTGLDPENDEILEIGLIIWEIYDSRINCTEKGIGCFRKVKVPKEVGELTHITQEMVDKLAKDDSTIANWLNELYEKYGKNAIFASYNLYFDASFFLGFCKNNNLSYNFDWLDILTIARDRYSYPHKLSDILDRHMNGSLKFGSRGKSRANLVQNVHNSHRAEDDVKAAYLIFFFMLQDFDDIGKYIGLIGHPKAHPFKKNKYILPYINNGKGRERGKILTKVQFYKYEYPLYFHEHRDLDIYRMQHQYQDDEIFDDFDDVDFKLNLGIQYRQK